MATRSRAPKTPIPRIRVVLSSRNNDLIPDGRKGTVPLGEVRKDLQEISGVSPISRFFGARLSTTIVTSGLVAVRALEPRRAGPGSSAGGGHHDECAPFGP